MTRLIGSASSLEQLRSMLDRYFYTNVRLIQSGDNAWTVHNSRGPIVGVRVLYRRGRYRFEIMEEL